MMAVVAWSIAVLAFLCMAIAVQQGIRLVRWSCELVKAHESLGEPGET